MKHRVKIVRMFMLTLIMLSLLASCGASGATKTTQAEVTDQKADIQTATDDSTAPDVETEKKPETNPLTEDLAFVELNYYIRASEQDNAEPVQKAMDEYFRDKLNCTVHVYPVPGQEWVQKMPLTLSSGEQVDLVFDQANTGFYTNVSNNLYLPLDALVAEFATDMLAEMDVNTPGLIDAPKVDGVLYGIPCQKQTAQSEAWYFRKDICDKYEFKIDELVTLQDLEPLLITIKDNEPDMVPYYVSAGTGVHMEWTTDAIKDNPFRYEELNGAVNLLIVDLETDKVMNHYETEWDLDRYTTLKRWQDEGLINPDAATTTTGGGDMFRAGKGWMVGGGGAPTTLSTYEVLFGTEFYRWRATQPITNTYQNTTALTCITRTTADAERSMMVINLFHTDREIVDLFNSGIEGTNYIVNAKGHFELPEGMTSQSDTGYAYGFETFFGNMFLNTLWENQPEDRYVELREYNQNARRSKIMGFYVDMKNITTEYAAVEAIRTQYAPILKAGAAQDVQATLDELNEKMYANGLQKIIDEVQTQYDEFIETHGKG
ncbi:MAG: ABC transporter substrate-binding protein [Bacillota bacterium]|nr:ABC transporter substrate-binding protein [Bacillota bacterium]